MLLHQHSESIAAVLLDLVMPEKDGYEVLEEMQQSKLLFQSPVVVITAEDSMDNRVKVFELGASDIIAKPFDPADPYVGAGGCQEDSYYCPDRQCF